MTSLTIELIIFIVAIILFGFFMYFVITPRLLKLLNKFGDSFVSPLLWLIESRFRGMASKPPTISQSNNYNTQINPPDDIQITPKKFICFINNIPKIITHQMELFRCFNSSKNSHRCQSAKQPIGKFTTNSDGKFFHSPDSNTDKNGNQPKENLTKLLQRWKFIRRGDILT